MYRKVHWCKIEATVNGKRVKNALVNEKIQFSTTYCSWSCKNMIWWFSDKTRSEDMTFKHSFDTPGVKRITCLCNNRYIMKKKIRILAVPEPEPEPEPEEEVDSNAITLNLVNQSNDANPVNLVLFQKNVANDFDETAVAWRIIQLSTEPVEVVYGSKLKLGFNRELFTSELTECLTGQKYEATTESLNLIGMSASPSQLELLNSGITNITGKIYRSNKLLGIKEGLAPAQTASFQFKPTFWIGVVYGISEGDILNSGTLSDINTEISLLGIRSSDIVMTGGGAGPSATPFSFSLQNVVYA